MSTTVAASFQDDSGETRLNGQLTTDGNQTGNQTITGTLHVTGATTLDSTVSGGAGTFTALTTSGSGAVNIGGPLNHDGATVGFYGTTPIAQQTGVGVSAGAIHAALVALGLITA